MIRVRVFWDETSFGNTEADDSILSTRTLGHPSIVGIFTVPCGASGCSPNTTGRELGPITTGDRGLTYSTFDVAIDGGGSLSITGAAVRRAVMRHGVFSHLLVPGAPGAALLAQAGHKLLEVPADTSHQTIRPGSTVQLRGDGTGSLRWAATTPGIIHAVGISGQYAAVLSRPAAGRPRIDAYDAATGSIVHTLFVRPTAAAFIGISGPRIVFVYPREIMLWNVTRNHVRLLHRTQRLARQFSVNEHTVTWDAGAKILGIKLP